MDVSMHRHTHKGTKRLYTTVAILCVMLDAASTSGEVLGAILFLFVEFQMSFSRSITVYTDALRIANSILRHVIHVVLWCCLESFSAGG